MPDPLFPLYYRVDGVERQVLGTHVRVGGESLPLTLYRRSVAPPEIPGHTIADLLADTPFYVGHRCGGGDWPEFSEAGINGCRGRGYKAVEMSVYRCGSGEFVLSHDWTTTRMTGVNYDISATPWATLSTLLQSAAETSNPAQASQPLLRLTDALTLAEGLVVFIDYKPNSSGDGDATALANEDALLDYLETLPNYQTRFVWKTFKEGYASADRAAARGFQTWGIYYDAAITTAPTRTSSFSLLGMNYNASTTNWTSATATGKKVLGHIITSNANRDSAVSKGAHGIMTSRPLLMP